MPYRIAPALSATRYASNRRSAQHPRLTGALPPRKRSHVYWSRSRNRRLPTKEATSVTHVHHSKLWQSLTIAAVFAALTATTVALAGTRASEHATPDSFERYASAHPYGRSVTSVNSTPDAFERYAVAHAPSALTDRRSPDTRSVADARQLTLADKRSPDTIDTATGSRTALAVAIIRPTGPRPTRQLRLGRCRHRRNRRSPHSRNAGRLTVAPTATTSPPPTCPDDITPVVATGRAGRVSTRPAHSGSWTGYGWVAPLP